MSMFTTSSTSTSPPISPSPPPPPPPLPIPAPPAPSRALPPKSPPLAFEKTSNDSLHAPVTAENQQNHHHHHRQYHHHHHRQSRDHSHSPAGMGLASPPSTGERELQVIVDRQSSAIDKLYEAFQAERDCWLLEKTRLHARIAALEQLLKSGDHWNSPAKSPVTTPGTGLASPVARHALPTISENSNGITTTTSSISNAPTPSSRGPSLVLSMDPIPEVDSRRQSGVYTDADGFRVEAIEPPARTAGLSPPPPNNRILAGHTPVRIPRRPTPPPVNMSLDGLEDTPTRNNTHINTLLSRSHSNDEDEALKGPLNMPELPSHPDETNFTLEALSRKLSMIEKDPESRDSKPMVFAQPSPGLASPVNELANELATGSSTLSPCTRSRLSEAPTAPQSTALPPSNLNSNMSPAASDVPTKGGVMSPQEVHEAKVHSEFEQGGIRLKKKSSTNFGAPFGSMATNFGGRKLS